MRGRTSLPALVVLFAASRAGAQGSANDAAADAYDRGLSAHARGDHATAAREFARADELVPSESALDAALDACEKSDEPVLCTRVAGRAERPSAAAVRGRAEGVRRRFQSRVGKVNVVCPSPCEALVDDAPVEIGSPILVVVGSHRVVAVQNGRRDRRDVDVGPGALVDVTFAAPTPKIVVPEPRPAEPSPAPKRSGLSPVWVVVGTGVAALGFGAAALSWADARSTKDAFASEGCERVGSDRCDDLASDGRSALVRTNVLIGAAAAVAVATVVVAAFFVEWRPRSSSGRSTSAPFVF